MTRMAPECDAMCAMVLVIGDSDGRAGGGF